MIVGKTLTHNFSTFWSNRFSQTTTQYTVEMKPGLYTVKFRRNLELQMVFIQKTLANNPKCETMSKSKEAEIQTISKPHR